MLWSRVSLGDALFQAAVNAFDCEGNTPIMMVR